jgi:peptidoglycan-associated lipoprotein
MKGFFISFAVITLAACASTPHSATDTNATKSQSVSASLPPAKTATTYTHPATLPPYLDPQNLLSQKRSIYFNFDDYNIEDKFKSIIEAHAKYLNGHRKQTIRIEGNADERGSREYNLALGQKRAEAVKKAMTIIGVEEKQIQAVSWGKEKPKALGHDETAWAENRRADIKYPEDK